MQAVEGTIIVKLIYIAQEGHIYIPENAKKYSGDFYGLVISVDPRNDLDLTLGSKVLFERHEGMAFQHNGEEYLVLKHKHVHGVIHD